MSFQMMTWAVEKELPMREKMVLLMLANHANAHSGRCDPSMKRLARECGTSVDSVIRATKSLEAMGLLQIVRRKSGDLNLRNSYLLLADGIERQIEETTFELTEYTADLQGVVAHSDHGSRTQRLGVVAHSDPNLEVKPVNKPVMQDNPLLAGFDQFWSAYPKQKHKAKTEALKAFKKINPSPDLLNLILQSIASLARTEDWKKNNGQFIPYPATFLNQRRWEDETEPTDPSKVGGLGYQ